MRVVASINTGTVRAYDVVTMLQRDGHPTALGEATASYGRIFKSLHILAHIDVDETYRRDIKGMATCRKAATPWPARSPTARKADCTTARIAAWKTSSASSASSSTAWLWTTVYLDPAIRQLRAQGDPVRPEDMARLSPLVSRHLGGLGSYSLLLPDLAPGAILDLRDPEAPDDEDET